jgi:prepilin peptidase CpaA
LADGSAMAPLQIALWTVLGVALLISVVTDLASRRILDVVTLPTIAVALALRAFRQGLGDLEHGLISGLVAGAAAAALFVPAAWRGRMGWGDVKLVGAVGATLGYPLVVAGLVFITLVGALQAVISLIWHGAVWQTVTATVRRWAASARLVSKTGAAVPTRHIPYGVAIAVGSLWAMLWQHANGAP